MEITIHEEKIGHFTFHGKKKGRSGVTKIPFTTLIFVSFALGQHILGLKISKPHILENDLAEESFTATDLTSRVFLQRFAATIGLKYKCMLLQCPCQRPSSFFLQTITLETF